MKNVLKTGECLHEMVSRFGAKSEWKYREPTSELASQAHIQKSRVRKMRLKKLEKDSDECESSIHDMGSELSFWSCERGQVVLSWELGERDIIS